MIGAIGMPVYAQFTGGLGILIGGTGGFLVGFIPAVFIMGYYLEKTSFTMMHALIANIIGLFITLIFGMVWFKFSAEITWTAACLGGFAPFIVCGFVQV